MATPRTPFSPVYNTSVPAVVTKVQLQCHIVPAAVTKAKLHLDIVPAATTPARQHIATPKPNSFFEATARTPHLPPEDDLAAYEPARLAALLARDVGSRRPSCNFKASRRAFDVVRCLAVRTGDSVVDAVSSRSMDQFHRLRRDLLALMPRLGGGHVLRVEALRGGTAPPPLPVLPATSLRRRSVRDATARDVATLSREGTARRLARKGPELTAWIRDVLAILRHRLGSQPSVAHAAAQTRAGRGAAAAAEALLVDFLLRGARLSVQHSGRVVVVHDGDEKLVDLSLLELVPRERFEPNLLYSCRLLEVERRRDL
jgi:hypothetical protein